MRRAIAEGAWPDDDPAAAPAAALLGGAATLPATTPVLSLTLEGRAFGLLRVLTARPEQLPLATGLLEDLCRHAPAHMHAQAAVANDASQKPVAASGGSAGPFLVDRRNPYFGLCVTAVVDGCLAAGKLDEALRLFHEAGPGKVGFVVVVSLAPLCGVASSLIFSSTGDNLSAISYLRPKSLQPPPPPASPRPHATPHSTTLHHPHATPHSTTLHHPHATPHSTTLM